MYVAKMVVTLKDFKDSYPVQLVEYAIRAGIQDEPSFLWWVHFTMKKRQRIISKLKSKYWQRSHKYGHDIPKNMKDAVWIDKDNKNNLWQDAIALEVNNNRIAFQLYNGNPKNLKGYKPVGAHLIFDIKLGEHFRRKARCVGDGHRTATPSSVTYSTVVSLDSVRIVLLIAALNELDTKCADIQNEYLTEPCA